MAAVLSHDPGRVRQLIDAGADVNAREGVFGDTAFTIAVHQSWADIVALILEAGGHLRVDSMTRNVTLVRARNCVGMQRERIISVVEKTLARDRPPDDPKQIRLIVGGPEDDWAGAPRCTAHELQIVENGTTTMISGVIELWLNRTDVAFDVRAQAGGQEWHVGTLVAAGGRGGRCEFAGELGIRGGREVRLLLVPNPRLAVARLDTWEIWGKRISVMAPKTR